MDLVPVAMRIMDSARPPAPAEIRARPLTVGEKLLRGLKRLGLSWLAAIPCVFVPLAHFVLVPALLITGVVLFVRALGAKVVLDACTVPCPKCTAPVGIDDGAVGWPVDLHCNGCGVSFDLRPS